MKAILGLLVLAAFAAATYITVVDRSTRAFGPHELADGHIRVTMPGRPAPDLTCTGEGPCVGHQAWIARLRGWNTVSIRAIGFRPLAYAVGMTDFSKSPKLPELAEMRARQAAAAMLGLETGHDFEVRRGQGTLGNSPANELIITSREGEVVWREMQVGSRYYVAAVAHHTAIPVGDDAQRFFESYSLPKGY